MLFHNPAQTHRRDNIPSAVAENCILTRHEQALDRWRCLGLLDPGYFRNCSLGKFAVAMTPPSTTKEWPMMNSESSLTKKSAAFA